MNESDILDLPTWKFLGNVIYNTKDEETSFYMDFLLYEKLYRITFVIDELQHVEIDKSMVN